MSRPLRAPRRALALLVIAVVSSGALLASGATATTRAHHARPVRSVAAACYTAVEANEHLTGADLGFIEKLLPCETAAPRPAIAGKLRVSALLSREAASLLKRNRTVPVAAGDRVDNALLATKANAYCYRRSADVRWDSEFGDSSPPPVLTPKVLASALAHKERTDKESVLFKQPATVYGFAYERRVVFKDEPSPPDPVGFVMIAYECY